MTAMTDRRRRSSGTRGRSCLTLLGVAAASLALSSPAVAQIRGNQSADRWVTIAARECDEYTDIRANLARNNIMESLQDLGRDTLYESGDPVDPATELVGQPACRPITGWRFTFGRGIAGQVEGVWGALSIVSDPEADEAVTEASVRLRDFDAHPVPGGARIAGAVTIGLNRDQVDASGRNSLWIQGGTTTDPVLFAQPRFAGRYGFGALRCAIDDLNGDNVETIAFPSGTRHMFCYAYYVTPPPSSGTIEIRKEVAGSEESESFHFSGNLSYNEGNVFDLSASEDNPGSMEFVRGETREGEPPWTVVEDLMEGWSLTALTCDSQSSPTTTNLQTRTAQISLVAGDRVTCTFTNRLTPPAGALVLRKVTRDGTGTFPFIIRNRQGRVATRRLTTRAEGGIGVVRAIKLDPGRYRITERRPGTRQGIWRVSRVRCNGERRRTSRSVVVRITAGRGSVCTFVNRLDRPGAIRVRAVSIGGLGTAAYFTSSVNDRSIRRVQFATTTREGRPARARGQSTDNLRFGRYVIQQSALSVRQRDEWRLIGVACNGRLRPFEQGRVIVRITRRTPGQRCTFVNLRRPAPPPPDPNPDPDPPPDPGPPDPVPGEATPDLVVTKRIVGAAHAESPRFTLRVTNRSAVTAKRVAVADRLPPGTRLVSARPSQGRCFDRGPRLLLCALGDLAPRASATIRVRVRRVSPGAGVNIAAVGAGSPESLLRNNVAGVRMARLPGPPGACPASAAPIARAAC
jgi:uncharacterized repeat protein (TIGR01451 family)